MDSSGIIEHAGVVSKIDGHRITVSFMALSACASCGAKNFCQISEQKEKEIEILDESGNYRIGDAVHVFMKQSSGLKAVMYGYFVPFLVMVTGLIAGNFFFAREWQTGLFAVGLAMLYYFCLYFFRRHIAKEFSFYIKKY
jgi:sigma-E factor negative regulatory protein RseC